jgi:hypothetical protein
VIAKLSRGTKDVRERDEHDPKNGNSQQRVARSDRESRLKAVTKVAATESIARPVADLPPPAEMASPPPKPVSGSLRVKIGQGFADIHCGSKIERQKFITTCELPPGRHHVFAEKPKNSAHGVPGRYAPREVEVDAEGRVWLIVAGDRVSRVTELMFRVARDKKEIEENPEDFKGWTSY